MVALQAGTRINGMDAAELRAYIDSVEADPANADRDPTVVARWVGGTRAAVTSSLGGPPVFMGGDEDPSAMGMLLRALAACDVEVVVARATLLGVKIEELTIEAKGYFNVARYLGIDTDEGAGYQHVSYVVNLKTADATPEQIESIREALDASPVADTLQRHVPVSFELNLS